MKNSIPFVLILLFLTQCTREKQKINIDDLYCGGPDNMGTTLINSMLKSESESKVLDLNILNDSLSKTNLPIEIRQVLFINEVITKVGLAFYIEEEKPYTLDLIEFWILINYQDDIGKQISPEILGDTVNEVLTVIDEDYMELYNNIRKNPCADSLYRAQILIKLNIKTNQDHQISMDDYNKLIGYMSIVAQLSVKRAEELSIKLWGKSYNCLEMRQKIAVCRLLGYLLIVNISSS